VLYHRMLIAQIILSFLWVSHNQTESHRTQVSHKLWILSIGLQEIQASY
jgi:hypothetical protein